MLDIQFIRDNPELVATKAAQKNYPVDTTQLLQADAARRTRQTQADELRRRRNEQAAGLKNQKPTAEQIAAGKQLKAELAELEADLKRMDEQLNELMKKVPNMPLDDVPVGATEDENVVSKKVGEPPVMPDARNHYQIAQSKGWMDKDRAAKVTGSRFTYLKGDMVRLQFAVIQFVFDRLSDESFLRSVIDENGLTASPKPFMPVLPPLMLRTSIYDAMDRLEPREDRYKIEGDDLWLQGSAEHVMGSMHADETILADEFPVRYIGYATSFRREAGTYGKDMEGMFRMHQFDKLEMESLTLPEDGLQEHLLLVAIQERLMRELGIPYQVLTKCTADIGKPNARGIDIEAWLPGQGKYRETHTADYMTDYQARRLATRFKRADGTTGLVHTNDATAMALSRGPIAIIENYQTADGDVRVPDVLKPYMGGKEVL